MAPSNPLPYTSPVLSRESVEETTSSTTTKKETVRQQEPSSSWRVLLRQNVVAPPLFVRLQNKFDHSRLASTTFGALAAVIAAAGRTLVASRLMLLPHSLMVLQADLPLGRP